MIIWEAKGALLRDPPNIFVFIPNSCQLHGRSETEFSTTILLVSRLTY